jgi:hypothetical protein
MQNKESKKDEFEYQIDRLKYNIALLIKARSYDKESPQGIIMNIVKDNQELGAKTLTMLIPLLRPNETNPNIIILSKDLIVNIIKTHQELGAKTLTILSQLFGDEYNSEALASGIIVNIGAINPELRNQALDILNLLASISKDDSIKESAKNAILHLTPLTSIEEERVPDCGWSSSTATNIARPELSRQDSIPTIIEDEDYDEDSVEILGSDD